MKSFTWTDLGSFWPKYGKFELLTEIYEPNVQDGWDEAYAGLLNLLGEDE